MAKFSYLIVAVLVVGALADATNYCGLQSCGGKQHTMCKFTSFEPSSRCTSYEAASLTADEKQEILEAHNKIMSEAVNQQTENVEPMQWDDELAEIAQRWANQCNVALDECRDVERFQVGQNVAVMAFDQGYKAKLSQLVDLWFRRSFPRPSPQEATRVSAPAQPQAATLKPAQAAVQPQLAPQQLVQAQWVYPQAAVQPQWVVYPQAQWVYPQRPVQWVYPQRPVQWVYPVVVKAPTRKGSALHFQTGYPRLVSGKATNVGCGVVRYMEHSWYATYLVCNYGPSNN